MLPSSDFVVKEMLEGIVAVFYFFLVQDKVLSLNSLKWRCFYPITEFLKALNVDFFSMIGTQFFKSHNRNTAGLRQWDGSDTCLGWRLVSESGLSLTLGGPTSTFSLAHHLCQQNQRPMKTERAALFCDSFPHPATDCNRGDEIKKRNLNRKD